MLQDEGNRRVYLQYMDMQARLVKLGDDETQIRRDVTRRSESAGSAFGKTNTWWARPSLRYAAVVLATVAATILVQVLVHRPAGERELIPPTAVTSATLTRTYVATLTQLSDVQWAREPGLPRWLASANWRIRIAAGDRAVGV